MIQKINANLSVLNQTKAMNFKRDSSNGAKVVVHEFQTFVPDLLSPMSRSYFTIPASGEKAQTPGFHVGTDLKDDKKVYTVYIGDLNAPKIKLSKKLGEKVFPEAKLKVGKFGPTIELIDREIGVRVQLLTNSRASIGDKLDVDILYKEPEASKKQVSFKGGGKLQVVTYHGEARTKEAVEGYMGAGLNKAVAKGEFFDEMQTNKPNIMVLAGGYGTRLLNVTGEDYTKPALKLPTDPNYRLMSNALDAAAKSGFSGNNVEYLSGQGTLKGANVKNVIQQTNLGDGGCIAKALFQGDTPTDAPLIILNADTFTNADITKAYKAFLDHPDAAILIPFYEAPADRATGFGLMSANTAEPSVEDGVYEIKSFVEKPKDLKKEAAGALVVGETDKYMANPGIYIISPKALEALKAKGNGINSELGLAKGFITPLVAQCQKGEFKDADGNPMKCYTAKLEKKGGGAAYWDDLGVDITIPKTFVDMAEQTKAHGFTSDNKYYGMPEFLLRDAVKNADVKTGRVYMNDDAKAKFEAFCKKYPGFETKGNVLVYDTIE